MFTLVDEAAFCAVATLDDDFSSTIQLLFVATLGLSLRCCLDRGSGFFFESSHSVTLSQSSGDGGGGGGGRDRGAGGVGGRAWVAGGVGGGVGGGSGGWYGSGCWL